MGASRPDQVGRVLGNPGGGLDNAAWAKNAAVARVGKAGEVRTAVILDAIAQRTGGPTVMHDLLIPIPGISANIDHLVISGRTVTIIDAKVWKPGFYWTFAGRTYRGWSRFTPAEKKTMPMALDALTRFLARHHVAAQLPTPLIVVWPSSQANPMSLWGIASHGARVIAGDRFARAARRLVGSKPADPNVVAVLAPLVNGPARHQPPAKPVHSPDPLDF